MVVKKCLVDVPGQPGMYQIDYANFEPLVKKRGRPSRQALERREDPRMPPISLAYTYGNDRYVVVERAFIFEGRVYSSFKKYLHFHSLRSEITKDISHLVTNIDHLFSKVRLPPIIREEIAKAFPGSSRKFGDNIPAFSSS